MDICLSNIQKINCWNV